MGNRLELFERKKKYALEIARRYRYSIPLNERKHIALVGLWKACCRHEENNHPDDMSCYYAKSFIVHELKIAFRREASRDVSLFNTSFKTKEALVYDIESGQLNPEEMLENVREGLARCKVAEETPRLKRWRGHSFTNKEVMDLVSGGKSQAEVARMFGVSKQRISQIVRDMRKAADDHA